MWGVTMLIDKIKRQLEYGGYRNVQASGFPCQIMIKKAENSYVVCLFEDSHILEGQNFKLDYIQRTVKMAVERQLMASCKTIALVISDDIGRDRVLVEGEEPVWLIDQAGQRIVFDNQPGQFGELEILLEKRVMPWNRWFPKGDKVPWITLFMVLINLIIQIIVEIQIQINGESALMEHMVLQIGRFKYNPQYYRLLTAAFLHFGWTHLFNNMLVLTFLGRLAEQIAGRLRFLTIYLFCAVGANIMSVIWYDWNNELYVATAGASGAVFAVAGMILAWLILGKGHLESVSLRQIVMLLVFTVYHGIAEGGVNNCAHITGAIMGFVFGILIWMKLAFEKKRRGAAQVLE